MFQAVLSTIVFPQIMVRRFKKYERTVVAAVDRIFGVATNALTEQACLWTLAQDADWACAVFSSGCFRLQAA